MKHKKSVCAVTAGQRSDAVRFATVAPQHNSVQLPHIFERTHCVGDNPLRLTVGVLDTERAKIFVASPIDVRTLGSNDSGWGQVRTHIARYGVTVTRVDSRREGRNAPIGRRPATEERLGVLRLSLRLNR